MPDSSLMATRPLPATDPLPAPAAGQATEPAGLVVTGLTKLFGERAALRRIDLRVTRGERIVLLGPNGAGKTTLLRVLALLLQPSAGRLWIGGQDPRAAGLALRQWIGFLGHQSALYPDLTVEENLAFAARLCPVAPDAARLTDLLNRFDLADRRSVRARTLSRGLQQRLALARTVQHDPPFLLLDEPDTGLDALGLERLADFLVASGRTVLISTHQVEWARRVCHRAIVLRAGQIVWDGPTADLDATDLPALYQRSTQTTPQPPAAGATAKPLPPGGPLAAPRAGSRDRAPAPAGTIRRTAEPPPVPARAGVGQVWAILRKDIQLEARRPEHLGTMALFTLLVLIVATFALDLAAEYAPLVAPGALWLAYVFAGTLGLGRGFAAELEWGTLEGLLLAPVHRVALYLAKTLGNILLMLVVEILSIPIFVAFFNLPVLRPELIGVFLLGTVGFAAVATLFAALAAQTRARDVLLPVLLFPVVTPIVIAAVKATTSIIAGEGPGPWFNILFAFDLVFVAVAGVVFESVLEE